MFAGISGFPDGTTVVVKDEVIISSGSIPIGSVVKIILQDRKTRRTTVQFEGKQYVIPNTTLAQGKRFDTKISDKNM